MRMPKHIKKGFTLIEMLIVIVVIAILASMLLGAFMQARHLARKTKADAQLRELISAWHQYYVTYIDGEPDGKWPTFVNKTPDGYVPMKYANLKYLISPDENPRKLVFLNVTLKTNNNNEEYKDPWGNVYQINFDETDKGVDETAQRISVYFPNRKRKYFGENNKP